MNFQQLGSLDQICKGAQVLIRTNGAARALLQILSTAGFLSRPSCLKGQCLVAAGGPTSSALIYMLLENGVSGLEPQIPPPLKGLRFLTLGSSENLAQGA